MDIILIGSNPSSRNEDCQIPFVGTQSHKTILEWMYYIKPSGEVHMLNVSNKPGKVYLDDATLDDFGPRLLDKLLDLDYKFIPYKIVALGDTAHRFLEVLDVTHFTLPHPSGRNRKLNDKKYVSRVLNECYAFIHEYGELY